MTWWRWDSTVVTSNPRCYCWWWWGVSTDCWCDWGCECECELPPRHHRHGGNTRRCLQPHWIFITRQLMNVEQYGSHLRRTTAWECRTPFHSVHGGSERANIDIDWIKTNIWVGNLASNLKRKFDQEQALSFTYVMQNKYTCTSVCWCNWYLNGHDGCLCHRCR